MKKFKWACGIISIILSIYVGSIFYASYSDNIVAYFLLIFENAAKCFAASPILKLSEVAEVTLTKDGNADEFLFFLYAIAVYLAPICTAGIILDTFKGVQYALFSFIFNIKSAFSKDIILIYGYNDMTKTLIENEREKGNKKLFYIVTNDDIKLTDKLYYIKHNTRVFNFEDFYRKFEVIAEKILLRLINKANIILLMDYDSTSNFSILIKLDKFINKENKNINNKFDIYCYVEDYHSKLMINEYIDEINKKRLDEKQEIKCNYETFDISRLRARQLLKNEKNKVVKNIKKQDIHNLIIGFGRMGHAIFDEILNESVYNQNGRIDIDIIGYDIDIEKNYILNKISTDYIYKINDDHYELSKNDNRSDGILNIRFYNLDITDRAFKDKLIEIDRRDNGNNHIDNIYICPKKEEICIRTLNIVNDLIKEVDDFGIKTKNSNGTYDINSANISIYIRLETNNEMVNLIDKSEDFLLKNVQMLIPKKDVLEIDVIKDYANKDIAIKFNYIYKLLSDKIYAAMENGQKLAFDDFANSARKIDWEQAKMLWNKTIFTNKEATWYLSLHTKVKKYLLEECDKQNKTESELKELLSINNNNISEFVSYIESHINSDLLQFIKIEHRRWNYNKAFNGFSYYENVTNDDKKYKKRHDCLLDFDNLLKKKADTIIYDLIPLIYIYIENNGAKVNE